MQGGMKVSITKCRINTVVSPDDGHIVARNMYKKEINIRRKIVDQVSYLTFLKVQIKFALEQAMKTQKGSRGVALLSLT